jgi:hypothetical protein
MPRLGQGLEKSHTGLEYPCKLAYFLNTLAPEDHRLPSVDPYDPLLGKPKKGQMYARVSGVRRTRMALGGQLARTSWGRTRLRR